MALQVRVSVLILLWLQSDLMGIDTQCIWSNYNTCLLFSLSIFCTQSFTVIDNESDNSPTANAASSDPSPRSSTARRSPVPSTSSREIGNDCNNGENGNGDDGNVDSELDNNNEVNADLINC